jgi:hypothetical protein
LLLVLLLALVEIDVCWGL